MAEPSLIALTDAILVIGIALTALLFAFGVRRLLAMPGATATPQPSVRRSAVSRAMSALISNLIPPGTARSARTRT